MGGVNAQRMSDYYYNSVLMTDSVKNYLSPHKATLCIQPAIQTLFSVLCMKLYVIYLGCRSFGGLQRRRLESLASMPENIPQQQPFLTGRLVRDAGAALPNMQQPRRGFFRIIAIAA